MIIYCKRKNSLYEHNYTFRLQIEEIKQLEQDSCVFFNYFFRFLLGLVVLFTNIGLYCIFSGNNLRMIVLRHLRF